MGIIGDTACPACRSMGGDSTGNHLMIFGSGVKYCRKCHVTFTPDGNVSTGGEYAWDEPFSSTPEKPATQGAVRSEPVTPESKEVSDAAIESIKQLPTGVTDRGIKGTLMSKYGIRFKQTPEGVTHHYYPITSGSKIISYKERDCKNKQFRIIKPTKGTKVDLFGMLAVTKPKGNDVLIVEGELDVPSADQMIGKEVSNLIILSVPFGTSVTKAVSDNLDFLKAQDSVTVCFDQDEPGHKAEEEIWKLLPNVKVMRISENDPNDMLYHMKTAEFRNAYHSAGKYQPKTIAVVENMKDLDVIAPVKRGLSYPFKGLDAMTYGIHKNQIIGIGAAPGVGKTTLVRAIQQHLMFHHKKKIGIFSLEEKAEWTTRLIVGYIMNKPIHIPGTIYSEAEALRVKSSLHGLAHFYEHKYYDGTWEEIANVIRYYHSIGVDYFFIDPLSSLVSHLTPSEANKYLSEAMYDMSRLVQSIDISIFHVNHLNTAADGKSHEAGARVYASQFTGSRAQWRYSHALIGAERNLLAIDGSENQMILRFLKDRAFGNTGKTCTLEYLRSTGRLRDYQGKSIII